MKLVERLQELDDRTEDVFVVHEKFERKFDRHQHKRGQLSYVEGGIAYIELDGNHWVIPAKHFIWIPAHMPHKLRVSSRATQLHSLYFSSFPKDEFYNNMGIYAANTLFTQIIAYSEHWNEEFVNYTAPRASILLALVEIIAEQTKVLNIKLPQTEHPGLQEILTYIETNYSEKLMIKQVCKQFNLSERSFYRLFKEELNCSFLQYLQTVRIINAIELILKTNESIQDIANKVGYESLTAFSNTFLAYTHTRPMDMRKHKTY